MSLFPLSLGGLGPSPRSSNASNENARQASAGTGKSFVLNTVFLYCLVKGKRCKAAAPTGASFLILARSRPLVPKATRPGKTCAVTTNAYQGLQLATLRSNVRTCEPAPFMHFSSSTMSSKRRSTLVKRRQVRESYSDWRCYSWTRCP